MKIFADVPKVVVGDEWNIRRTDQLPNPKVSEQVQRVVAIDADGAPWILGEIPAEGQKVWWKWNDEKSGPVEIYKFDMGAANAIGELLHRDRNPGRLVFPLEVGKRYEITEYSARNLTKVNWRFHVVEVESVTTDAGTFDAWKIAGDGVWMERNTSRTGSYTATLWYAPAVKRFLRLDFRELNSVGRPTVVVRTEVTGWKPAGK